MGVFYGNEPPSHTGAKQPYEGKKLAAALLVTVAAASTYVPPRHEVQAQTHVAWIAEAPIPQRGVRIAALIQPDVPVETPPGVDVPKIVEIPDDYPQQQRRSIAPFVAGTPIPSKPQQTVYIAWASSDPGLQQQRKVPIVAAADQPSVPKWLRSVLEAWTPVDPPPQASKKFSGVRIDNPPFGKRILDQTPWNVELFSFVQLRKVYYPQAAVVVEQPPARWQWLSSVLDQWQDPAPLPQQRRTLTVNGVQVDFPPTNSRHDSWTYTVYASWEAPPPRPQPHGMLTPPDGFTPPAVDDILHNLPFIVTTGKMKSF